MNRGLVDIRYHLESGGSEDGTETDTHGKPESTQDGNEMITRSTEGGQDIQGEESGEGG